MTSAQVGGQSPELDPVVVFIGGSSRSGSTLVDRLLALGKHSVSLGEVRFIWSRGWRDNELCGCGTPFQECPFWSRVFDRLRAAEVDPLDPAIDRMRMELEKAPQLVHFLLRGRGVQGPVRETAIRFGRILETLYRCVAQESGKRFLIDSSKWPSQLWPLVLASNLDVRLLHLVRDPRAVAYSWSRARERPEVHWARAYMRRVGPVAASAAWSVINASFDRLGKDVPYSTRMQYEEIVQDPSKTLMRARQLLALSPAEVDRTLRFGGPVDLPAAHSISGNPMRFQTGQVEIVLDDAWVSRQPAFSKSVVSVLTFPLRLRYGYSGSRMSSESPLREGSS